MKTISSYSIIKGRSIWRFYFQTQHHSRNRELLEGIMPIRIDKITSCEILRTENIFVMDDQRAAHQIFAP